MQYLKDDVKNKIMAAALKEFKQYGYLHSSMRRIAQDAGITTGNIYRYFKNKEQLFDEIVRPTYVKSIRFTEEMKRKLESHPTDLASKGSETPYLPLIYQSVFEVFQESSQELRILLICSEGSKYASMKQDLIELTLSILTDKFMSKTSPNAPLEQDRMNVARMLATTIIEGLCIILRDFEDSATVKLLADELVRVYAAGIAALTPL